MNRNDRALTACTMLGHATFHTFELTIPVFVVLWLDAFGATGAELGVIVGAGYALVGLGALPAGALADAYDAQTLVVASMLGMSAGFALLGLAASLPTLAVGLLAWGIAASLYHPAGLSLISRGASRRGRAFAYHGVAGNLGVAVGPLLAAIVLVVLDWRVVAVALAVPGAIAAAVAWRLSFDADAALTDDDRGDTETTTDDDDREEGFGVDARTLISESRRLVAGGFLPVLAIGMLYGVYYRGVLTFLPAVLGELDVFDVVEVASRAFPPERYVYAGLLLLGGVGQYAGGRLADHVVVERALLWTFSALIAIALLFTPAAETGVLALLAVGALLGFVLFLAPPMHQSLLAKHVSPSSHGLSFGYVYLATFGVGALGATAGGVLLTVGGPVALFAALAAVAGVAVLVVGWVIVRAEI